MTVTVKIVDREPGFARYFVYDEHGIEIRQVHRDVTKELARAVRQHRSLTQVLEEEEGA